MWYDVKILILINWHDSDFHQLTRYWYSSIDKILIFINWQDSDIHQLTWYWYSSINMILIFINWHDSDIHQLTWFWYSSIDMILIFINWHDSDINQLRWFWYSWIDMILIFTNQCPWNKYSTVTQELHSIYRVIYFSIYINITPYIGPDTFIILRKNLRLFPWKLQLLLLLISEEIENVMLCDTDFYKKNQVM